MGFGKIFVDITNENWRHEGALERVRMCALLKGASQVLPHHDAGKGMSQRLRLQREGSEMLLALAML